MGASFRSPEYVPAPAAGLVRAAVAGWHDEGPGGVVADPLAMPRAEHRDQAHQAEEQGVDDQQDAADEELHHAGLAAVLADHPQAQQLHAERLTAVAMRPGDPVPEVNGDRDGRRQQPAEAEQDPVAPAEQPVGQAGNDAGQHVVDDVLDHATASDPGPLLADRAHRARLAVLSLIAARIGAALLLSGHRALVRYAGRLTQMRALLRVSPRPGRVPLRHAAHVIPRSIPPCEVLGAGLPG